MIDHISIYALNFSAAKKFYINAFAPLGYTLISEFVSDSDNCHVCSFGVDNKAHFWIIETRTQSTPRHIAFSANTQNAVNEFYEAALDAGAKDNGSPGIRKHYHENYYAAFVIDPDGNDIEAVYHG